MKAFLSSNPGLASRFVNTFHFEDYNSEELLIIAQKMAESSGYFFDEQSVEALKKKFTHIYENRCSTFGNARTAKNELMQIISNQEKRIAGLINPSDLDLQRLTKYDIGIE